MANTHDDQSLTFSFLFYILSLSIQHVNMHSVNIHPLSVCCAAAKGLVHGDIAPTLTKNADPCTATGCKWPKSGSHVTVPVSISSVYCKQHKLYP